MRKDLDKQSTCLNLHKKVINQTHYQILTEISLFKPSRKEVNKMMGET